ncbi:DUF1566 domain-containing protein [candidate division KSB1 bacterium]|nr:DUF1566 domain-containing protein [candidate division KSB1 bacterium]
MQKPLYPIIDTGQTKCYDNGSEIPAPDFGEPFYGQDAQHTGNPPSYIDNGDGTITDTITGLMWQKSLPDEKYSYDECLAYADQCTLAGYSDWRLPTIKELYSLILFSGKTGLQETTSIPYLDTDYFDFRFGGTIVPDERFIDVQYATTTLYKGTTMGGNETMFGVNFVDGRIKGYPTFKKFEIKLVRGRSYYGLNDFVDTGDGTITDQATGLMWDKSGSREGMDWQIALQWVVEKNQENYLGYNDWRLPNAKELQSIVDYDRSPEYSNSAAISPLFDVPVITDEDGDEDYPFYWTSTTHDDGLYPDKAVYLSFGRALGFMEMPPNSNNYVLQDVHGAGAQRSDPKSGNPDNYPYGHGPQGDVIRIFNFVRLVRDANSPTFIDQEPVGTTHLPGQFVLEQNYPNPFNPSTRISFDSAREGLISLKIFNAVGQQIDSLVDRTLPAGRHEITWHPDRLPGGVYFYALTVDNITLHSRKMIYLR